MGDHRINLKIEFEMHGHKDNLDAWWNFTDRGEVHGVDYRAIEWLQQNYHLAMERWEDGQRKDRWAGRMSAAERQERAELARLKEKYEGGGSNGALVNK